MLYYNTNRILRSEDPFDMAAGEVDTSFPLLKAKLRKMEIENVELTHKKDDEAVRMLNITLKTLEDEESVSGPVLYAGAKGFTTIVLTPTGKLDQKMINRTLASFMQAADGAKTPIKMSDFLKDISMFNGRNVMVKTSIQEEKDGYPARNNFRFVPPGE